MTNYPNDDKSQEMTALQHWTATELVLLLYMTIKLLMKPKYHLTLAKSSHTSIKLIPVGGRDSGHMETMDSSLQITLRLLITPNYRLCRE